jgi:hypothetical protein
VTPLGEMLAGIALGVQAVLLAWGAVAFARAWRDYRRTLPGTSVLKIWLSLYRDDQPPSRLP